MSIGIVDANAINLSKLELMLHIFSVKIDMQRPPPDDMFVCMREYSFGSLSLKQCISLLSLSMSSHISLFKKLNFKSIYHWAQIILINGFVESVTYMHIVCTVGWYAVEVSQQRDCLCVIRVIVECVIVLVCVW